MISLKTSIHKNITCFPNPFNDKIIITLSSDIDISEIIVYNSIGQEIVNKPKLEGNQLIINLTQEPNGLYYLIIKDNNKIIQTKKLIKL